MNLLVTGAWKQALDYIERLKKQHKIIYMQWEKEKLPCEYEWVEGIIGNGIFLSHPIERFTNLKYIQLTSTGYDRVPMEYVKEHNIEIYNAKNVYSIPMAEFAVAGVLQLYKQDRYFMNNQKKHKWERHRGLLELYGKNVCIVGCGDVGDECAKRFQAFGCHVIGVNRSEHENKFYEKIYKLNNLKLVIKNADIIIITIALTTETRCLINRAALKNIKKTAIFVNIARGAVVDMEALKEKLPQIGGAVLDVFEEEPLSTESELWNMENVIVTPHNSFVGDGTAKRLNEVIEKNLERR